MTPPTSEVCDTHEANRLLMSSSNFDRPTTSSLEVVGLGDRLDEREELTCDVALQTAHDLGLGQSLRSPPFDVGPGRSVTAHAHQDDGPQRRVGLAVPAAVETM